MMTNPQLTETLVHERRSSLLREAGVRKLRKRAVRAVVRTAAPTVRSEIPVPVPAPAPEPVRELEPV
jgi:hypothetical protein